MKMNTFYLVVDKLVYCWFEYRSVIYYFLNRSETFKIKNISIRFLRRGKVEEGGESEGIGRPGLGLTIVMDLISIFRLNIDEQ